MGSSARTGPCPWRLEGPEPVLVFTYVFGVMLGRILLYASSGGPLLVNTGSADTYGLIVSRPSF